MKECDPKALLDLMKANISIHALYERVRLVVTPKAHQPKLFQSTHSMKECDGGQAWNLYQTGDFNPRTL